MTEQEQYLPMREVPVNKPDENIEAADGNAVGRFYCALHERPPRVFAPDVTSERVRLINLLGNKWVSGTVLRYYFFDKDTDGQNIQFTNGITEWRTWVGN